MAPQLKIGTLNLCLGLKNKKDLVKDILMSNEIDILAMQEIELESTFDTNLLNIQRNTRWEQGRVWLLSAL